MKIFLTGATGFVGSHLLKRLSEEGHTVHALVRSKKKSEGLIFNNVHFFEGDILNIQSIEAAIESCEYVYHVAACTSIWEKNAKTYYDINVTGTENVLDASKKYGIKKVVVTSSAGVYGPSIDGIVTESTINKWTFKNDYEWTKAQSEIVIKNYVKKYDMDITIVNPTRIYGNAIIGSPNPIYVLINDYIKGQWRLLPGKGTQIANYVYIDDVVEGHIKAMEIGRKGENYILGGENVSYIELFDAAKKIGGVDHKLIKAHYKLQIAHSGIQLILAKTIGKKPIVTPKWVKKFNMDWVVSSEKAREELGIESTPLLEGIKQILVGDLFLR